MLILVLNACPWPYYNNVLIDSYVDCEAPSVGAFFKEKALLGTFSEYCISMQSDVTIGEQMSLAATRVQCRKESVQRSYFCANQLI